MNHLNAITAQLDAYQLDALCITSEPGEYYAVGVKGEGLVLVGGLVRVRRFLGR